MPRANRSKGEQPEETTQQSATTGPKVGDLVICVTRLPSPLRPWENPIWIGEIEQPGTDPSRWSGKYSEAAFCQFSRKRRVRYHNPGDPSDTFTQHDKIDSLIVLSPDEA